MRVTGFAEGASDAVQWLSSSEDWDIALIDIFIKQGSGLEVLKVARGLAGAKFLIVVSNYATSDMRRRCYELGAHRVFDKSKEIDDLIAYCRSISRGEIAL